MNTVTISKELAKEGDLVVISRKEYEELKALKKVREIAPTSTQKWALKLARRNRASGKTLSLYE